MTVRILKGDCREVLKTLPDESAHCCVTSPPYFGLRDYGVDGQIGLEQTPQEYVEQLVAIFQQVRRVLRNDGTLWLNLGDSYWGSWANYSGGERGAGKQRLIKHGSSPQNPVWDGLEDYRPAASFKHDVLKPKDLIGIPWHVAFALQADGWWLRQDIIWSKPNPMPESVTDRCTKAHEYIFLLSKSARYHYDADAIKEPIAAGSIERFGNGYDRKSPGAAPERNDTDRNYFGEKTCGFSVNGRNKRSIWEVTTKPYNEAHFATFPDSLIEPCLLAGCPEGGIVLDPFAGAGTTGMVADRLRRSAILIELNPDYADIAEKRLRNDAGMFSEVVNQ